MEVSAKEFLAEVLGLGVDIEAVALDAPPEFDLVPVHRLGVATGLTRASQYRDFVQRATAHLAQERWDIIHSVVPCTRCDLYQPRGGVVREALNRSVATRKHPISRWFRGLAGKWDRKLRLLTRLEEQLLQHDAPTMVVALSRYMREQLTRIYRLPDDRIRVVFNGVAVEPPEPGERENTRSRVRAELGLRPDSLLAIFVSQNFRRKGLACALQALALPAAGAWELLVVGGDDSTSYRRLAERFQLGTRVHFLGSRPDVRQLHLAADASILPTYYDPCSRVVLEALSLGLPCITTTYNGAADVIRNGEQGYVVECPESVPAIADSLRKLEDSSARQRMSRNALGLHSYLSMRRHAQEIVRLYEQIHKQKSQR